METDDGLQYVSSITAAMPSENAVVVAADIYPLAEPDNGARWYVPAGGLVYAVAGPSETEEVGDGRRRAPFPRVTAYLDGTASEEPSALAERELYVFGVAPDGTTVHGDVVRSHQNSYSRIAVQVSGTATVAAADARAFQYGDLVCAQLDTAEMAFKDGDPAFRTGKLVPWKPWLDTDQPKGEIPDRVLDWHIARGLQSFQRAERAGEFLLEEDNPNPHYYNSFGGKTWLTLMKRFNERIDRVAAETGEDIKKIEDPVILAAVGFDRLVTNNYNFVTRSFVQVPNSGNTRRVAFGIFTLFQVLLEKEDKRDVEAYNRMISDFESKAQPASDDDSETMKKLFSEDAPLFYYAVNWNATAIDLGQTVLLSLDLPALPGAVKPDYEYENKTTSRTQWQFEGIKSDWYWAALFVEAAARGPLTVSVDEIGTQRMMQSAQAAYRLLYHPDEMDSLATVAIKWAGKTTLPFGRVLEVGLNELRIDLKPELSIASPY